MFLECENIDRRFCASDEEQKQNKIRLNFYRRFGAVQLIDSKYEKWRRGDSSLHLLFDNNHRRHPDSKALEKIVKAILVSHGPEKCSEDYIKEVVASLKESHFEKLPKHLSSPQRITSSTYHKVPDDQKIPLTLNPLHRIHHVTEKGYVESPIRIDAILKELDKVNYFELKKTKHFPDSHITEVHDPQYFQFLKDICKYAGKKTMYPDVFPIRNRARLPLGLEEQAGYYCMDVYSPINQNAYLSSRAAVDCALTAAETLVEGENVAYALVRPPGHHAERRFFGGFCYLNSTAIAAHFLSKHGRVAILDVDYHHGNGQQNIFYERPDVLTVSIHGHPEHAYPHFTGFEDEKGEGLGLNYNVNHPLPLTMDGPTYLKTLKVAAEQILKFDPSYVVVALGLDTAKGDPTGTWKLLARDFEENGFQIGGLQKPTLVVQEGGYRTQVLGVNVRHFFRGLMKGYYQN